MYLITKLSFPDKCYVLLLYGYKGLNAAFNLVTKKLLIYTVNFLNSGGERASDMGRHEL